MACNCKKDVEERLTKHYADNHPQAKGHEVSLQWYAYTFGEGVSVRAYMPYKATAVHTLKSGAEKSKSITGNMFFNYCPFCGESLTKEATK